MCHRPGPPIALHLTYIPRKLSCDQIKEGGFVSFYFISRRLCQSLSTAKHFVTQQILLSVYIVFAMVNLSTFLYIRITAGDRFVSPELLEVKTDKIQKKATQN